MDNQKHIEELAYKLFYETHQIWTEDERKKSWEAEQGTRDRYIWLAEISFRFFESIYYSL